MGTGGSPADKEGVLYVDVLYVESDNFAALSSFTHHTIDASIQSGIGFIK